MKYNTIMIIPSTNNIIMIVMGFKILIMKKIKLLYMGWIIHYCSPNSQLTYPQTVITYKRESTDAKQRMHDSNIENQMCP